MPSHSWPFWVPLTPQSVNTNSPQQADSAEDTTERKSDSHKTAGHKKKHRYFPEVPGSSEQETLHCKELQDLFFVKSLLSKADGIHGFLDTETDTEWQIK